MGFPCWGALAAGCRRRSARGFPDRLAGRCRLRPCHADADEVEPWVSTIIRLWTTKEQYRLCCEAAFERSRLWQPMCWPVYREFFGGGHLPAGQLRDDRMKRNWLSPLRPSMDLVRAWPPRGRRLADGGHGTVQQASGFATPASASCWSLCGVGCWVALKAVAQIHVSLSVGAERSCWSWCCWRSSVKLADSRLAARSRTGSRHLLDAVGSRRGTGRGDLSTTGAGGRRLERLWKLVLRFRWDRADGFPPAAEPS